MYQDGAVSGPVVSDLQPTQINVQAAFCAGRDAACIWRSNERCVGRANKLASLIVKAQCPAELYFVAVAAFNSEMHGYAYAFVDLQGHVAVCVHSSRSASPALSA